MSAPIPLVYKGRGTAWFSDRAAGFAFIAGRPTLASRHPCLLELRGLEDLHRIATMLRDEGVTDIYFDLLPDRNARADCLDGFISELRLRLEGRASPVVN
jgi:hypothetical protein